MPAREVRPGPSQTTSMYERDVVACTCTVVLVSGVRAPRQLALSLLGMIFSSPIGGASQVLVKNPGWRRIHTERMRHEEGHGHSLWECEARWITGDSAGLTCGLGDE